MILINVLLVDEQRLFNEAMKSLLSSEKNIHVSGMATNGTEAIQQIKEKQPDIVLMDLHSPHVNGIKLTVYIKENFPNIKAILLTNFAKEDPIIKAIIAGADAFLLKTIDAKSLIKSIHDTYHGEIVFSGKVAEILANRISEMTCDQKTILKQKLMNRNICLTNRELDIAYLLMDHQSNYKIAKRLYLSEGTVKNYLSDLYQKFNLRNRQELIEYLHRLLKDYDS